MQIDISGKGIEIGESLRTHAETRLQEGLNKYLNRVVSVDVIISREAHLLHVSIHSNIGTSAGIILKSQGEADDVYAAFDQAAAKIEKQLRRYKRRLTDHHAHSSHAKEMRATKYIIDSQRDTEEDITEQSLIIAEHDNHIYQLTVSEAVMRMDLGELPALLFHNATNGRLNLVYRRPDGNIAWVDPTELAATKAA